MYLSRMVCVWNVNIAQKSIFRYADNKYGPTNENVISAISTVAKTETRKIVIFIS